MTPSGDQTEHRRVPGDAEGAVPADDVATRSELLPEERAAGSDDPDGQAEAILEESEARTTRREETAGEHRRSPDTVEPTEQ